MENGSHPSHGEREVAQIALADGLVDATPESIRELADSAIVVSQERTTIEMQREADSTSLDVPVTTAVAQG